MYRQVFRDRGFLHVRMVSDNSVLCHYWRCVHLTSLQKDVGHELGCMRIIAYFSWLVKSWNGGYFLSEVVSPSPFGLVPFSFSFFPHEREMYDPPFQPPRCSTTPR